LTKREALEKKITGWIASFESIMYANMYCILNNAVSIKIETEMTIYLTLKAVDDKTRALMR